MSDEALTETIKVSDEVWGWLMKKKLELRAKSVNEVINILIVDRTAAEAKTR